MSYLLDLHVYTNNTPGTKDKISFLCETAAEKNIRAVAFTDVIEPGRLSPFDLTRQVRHAFFDISKAKQLFFDTVSVFAGIELRQAYLYPDAVKKILASQPFDIVLSGVYANEAGETYDLPAEIAQPAFNAFAGTYCEQLLRTVAETDFDVLSRILAPLRGTRCDYALFEERMHGVLDALAAKGRALEVDTKDVLGSERIRDLYLRLVAYFKNAGGEYVTIGSESLSHDELGAGIDLAMSAVKRAGFSCFTFYDHRIPYTVKM